MKPWARFVFVLIAYGIALLHTAVPHHHFQPTAGDPVIRHKGCVPLEDQAGLLFRVLATDLGVGHLETFKQNADTELDFTGRCIAVVPLLPSPAALLSASTGFSAFLSRDIEKIGRQRLLLSVTSFRGPPAL